MDCSSSGFPITTWHGMERGKSKLIGHDLVAHGSFRDQARDQARDKISRFGVRLESDTSLAAPAFVFMPKLCSARVLTLRRNCTVPCGWLSLARCMTKVSQMESFTRWNHLPDRGVLLAWIRWVSFTSHFSSLPFLPQWLLTGRRAQCLAKKHKDNVEEAGATARSREWIWQHNGRIKPCQCMKMHRGGDQYRILF